MQGDFGWSRLGVDAMQKLMNSETENEGMESATFGGGCC